MDKQKAKRIVSYLFSKRFWVSQFVAKQSLCNHLPDKTYLKLWYYANTGKKLNLKNPQTFSEKLQWLKLYNRNPQYTIMVDKYAVKQYVADLIGDEYIIPTIGVWERPEDIDFESLPNQFVLKCNHDSGGLIICRDKSKLDKEAAISRLNKSLKTDFYKMGREWPYKNVPRRIIAENYIEAAPNTQDITDYKWYCFGGDPRFCQVIQNRNSNETIDFFDTCWNHQNFIGLSSKAENAKELPNRPNNLETHLKICKELSRGIPFSRIDLYEVGENIFFGEVTFYPHAGIGKFRPEKYNELLGQMIHLPWEKYGGGVIIKVSQDGTLCISKPDLPDYKFFCFNGELKCCQVITGRESKMCVDFFDREWNHMPFIEPSKYTFSEESIIKPVNFELMCKLAETLSRNVPFVRVDFYNLSGKILFGELTFFPTSGIGGFAPPVWNEYFGSWINLPN